jgi:DNA-binding transcriptional regulator WhiA
LGSVFSPIRRLRVNQSDESLDELVSVLRSNEMSKEDLAAARLAAFYDSKMTQSVLTTFCSFQI